jgi:hypothetical protein
VSEHRVSAPADLELSVGYRARQIRRESTPQIRTQTRGDVAWEELSERPSSGPGRRWQLVARLLDALPRSD